MSRIGNVRQSIKEKGLDALFISDQYNVSYLTGCRGLSPFERESFLFITGVTAYLLTFPTYFDLFNRKDAPFTALNITQDKRLRHHLNDIVKEEHVGTIGFEKDNLTVNEYEQLKEHVPVPWQSTGEIVESLRLIKDEGELTAIGRAAVATDEVFSFLRGSIHAGQTEKELAVELEYQIKKRADDVAFSPIVAFNEHAAIPHYLPTNDQRLKTSDLILLDFGAKVDGYCSDMTRVVFFGKPKDEHKKVYETVLEAQKRALEYLTTSKAYVPSLKVREGQGELYRSAEVDRIARNYITSRGYPEYQHGLGHGVGLAIHEAPRLRRGGTDELKPGMVVTVEPGIYLPGICGVRIEDLVVLTDDGIEVLSKSSKELIII